MIDSNDRERFPEVKDEIRTEEYLPPPEMVTASQRAHDVLGPGAPLVVC